jgi:invasion protein IalB
MPTMELNANRRWRRLANIGAAVLAASLGAVSAVRAQDPASAAWRVECAGDGKVLECRALQQIVNRDDKRLLAQLTVRLPPDSKTPVMMLQLPLGLNLSEPVQFKVDNGTVEKQPVQTCTTTGCFVGMQLNDKFLASMRGGALLKIALQDSNKQPIALDVPLLGFSLAFDKAK